MVPSSNTTLQPNNVSVYNAHHNASYAHQQQHVYHVFPQNISTKTIAIQHVLIRHIQIAMDSKSVNYANIHVDNVIINCNAKHVSIVSCFKLILNDVLNIVHKDI